MLGINSKRTKWCTTGMVWLVLGLCCVLFSGQSAFAQADLGTITGVVHDNKGAVVPSAQATVTNEATGVAQSVTANSQGIYVVTNLVVGTYTLRVSSPGFKNFVRSGIVLDVGSTVKADAPLAVGTATQKVVVEANRVQVQSETSDVSTVITSTQLDEIPTNGRNLYQLAELVPGVSSSLPSFDAPDAIDLSDSIFVNGDKRRNLYLINGGIAQDGGCTGCMSMAPSQSAIAQVKITTGDAPADMALASGGYENFSVKSGTSNLHGQLWEYNRNDAYDANDYFAKLSQTPKPELRYNLFGFNVGGPVYIPRLYKHRNKTFFFFNIEWRKLIQGGQIYQFTMPSETFNGNFGGLSPIKVPQTNDPAAIAKFASFGLTPGEVFPNNAIPAGLIDPNVKLLLATGIFPQPNTPDGTHYSSPAPNTVDMHEEVLRVDHQFNSIFSLMASFVNENAGLTEATAGGGDSYPTVGTRRKSPSYSGQFRLMDDFRSNLFNETSFDIDEIGEEEFPTGTYVLPTGYSAIPYFTGVNELNRIPEIDIGSPYGVNWTTRDLPTDSIYHNRQIEDTLTWVKGKHQFNFGASYIWALKHQRFSTETQGIYSFSGTFTGNAFADFLLGYAANYNQAINQDYVNVATHRIDLFVTDNYKVTPRLTLNLGLHWEMVPPAYDVNDAFSSFDSSAYNQADAPIFNPDGSLDPNGPGFTYVTGVPHAITSIPFYMNGVVLAGRNGTPRGLVETDHNDFGPHAGFAYAFGSDSRTVLRGGFGMFYQRLSGNDVYDNGAQPPFSFTPSANNVYFSNPATSNVTGLTASQPIFPVSLSALNPYFPLPTSVQFNLGVQRQLSPIAVLGIAYVGNVLYNQPNEVNINAVPLSDPNRIAICGGNCGYTGSVYDPNLDRHFPGFGTISNLFETDLHSTYNSLQTSLLIHARRDLNISVAYTWSHAIDYGSGDEAGFSNPYNFVYDKGSADYDRRHVLQTSYFYVLPFFRHSENRLARGTLANWQLSGITTFETGNPLSAELGYDNTGLGGGTDSRADITGSITYPKTQAHWFGSSSFAAPGPLVFGNSGRNTITGPGLDNWNMALAKNVPLWREGSQLQVRVEAYNVFNHTQFSGVNNSFSSGPTEFGQVTSTNTPRVLELGAQLSW